ncbi:MAG: alpha/beta hydrolase [Thermoguttaceae bacterium]|nr:alpha/beta hydrolase [Thermoguttaceae bacterium]
MTFKSKIVLDFCGFLVLAAASILIIGCGGSGEPWSPEDGQFIPNQVYDKDRNLVYDLYIPKDLKKDAPVRLFLFIHGGAWKGGNRHEQDYACRSYAKNGCVTATIEYSLLSGKHPEVTILTMLDQITACISDIKEKLAAEGYQTSKIALSGVSAGGHLALLYSYSRAEESPIPIAFVFEFVGPSDFCERTLGAEKSAKFLTFVTGQKIAPEDLNKPEIKKLGESLSPLSFVTEKSVPTICAYGGKDWLVPACHRDALVQALEKNGVPHVCVDFPNSDHGMGNDPDKAEEFQKAVFSYCEKYMP